ncbi:hypothetical protein BJ508DRAFT_326462 [Ascobolus immersus RN42]|uniref:Uncharacterized protein n=1 Tax=Ascobolus immersus RN42 TaxID=1160509 RepID=A0A3N4I5F6_ASCIM|nr:hypothetical protein BJ508DRAFT_326462 [Ascobolus immersus RN42]
MPGFDLSRIILTINTALATLLNTHTSLTLDAGSLTSALIYESGIVTSKLYSLTKIHRGESDYTKKHIRLFRAMRDETPVTNGLLDALQKEFGRRFRSQWLDGLRELTRLYAECLPFEEYCEPCPELDCWEEMFECWVEVELMYAGMDGMTKEDRGESRRIVKGVQDLARITEVLGTRIDVEKGEEFMRKVVDEDFDDMGHALYW